MATDPLYSNPDTTSVEPHFSFDGEAVLAPPGTKAPPRPPGMERKPWPSDQQFGWECHEFDGEAVPAPPGTKAPPRPPGLERKPRHPEPASGTPEQQLDGIICQLEALLAHVKSLRGRTD